LNKFIKNISVLLILAFILMLPLQAAHKKKEIDGKLMSRSVNKNPTPAALRLQNYEKHKQLEENSIFKSLKWQMIGPFEVSGRITDIAVPKDKPYTFYIAAASGGVWKTENNGITWKPIFEKARMITIGDIAIDPSDSDTIYVGTGENNSSRSTYAGTGIYKTTDGGKNWKHLGLAETHHTGRIIVHPTNPEIIYVAAVGHLFTYNEERGVYKSTNGGETWEKILYVNEKTGAIDLIMDPENSDILYASMWERDRRAWNFVENGEGTGLYKTDNGGKNWTKLTCEFPDNRNIGRIGIDICKKNPNIIYALIDNQNPKPQPEKKKKKPEEGLKASDLKNMTKKEFLALNNKTIEKLLKEYNIPEEYTADRVKYMVTADILTLEQIADYLIDANQALFETNIIGAEVYRSDDKGKTWKKVNKTPLNRLYNTYGYYFGEIRVNPKNPDEVYILGVPLMKSVDGGVNFKNIGGRNVHADHHALWIDPEFPDHIINGNDGGLNISYDGGENWIKARILPISQFYSINYDFKKPYNVYGGLQDNGVVMGSSANTPQNWEPWKSILGGDGGMICIDYDNEDIVYTEFQYGNLYRINLKNEKRTSIKPKAKIGEPKLRFNWVSPIEISNFNSQIIYFGGNKLFKSYNRGDDWFPISEDLTTNPEIQGDVPYATLTTISESPIDPNLLYVGTDDGLVWVTHNGGDKWNNITQGFPEGKWITRVVASKHKKSRVYVAATGYRQDDFKTYIYTSENYGQTYEEISSNLPEEPVNAFREDPDNKNIIYLGTETGGVYASFNKGKEWHSLSYNLPEVAIYDLKIHPREKDLIIGTHGRSAYILNIQPVQKVTEEIRKQEFYIFEPEPVLLTFYSLYNMYFLTDSPEIYFYLNKKEEIELEVIGTDGKTIFKKTLQGNKGLNFSEINLRKHLGRRISPQTLTLKFKIKGEEYTKKLELKKGKTYTESIPETSEK